MKLSDSNDQEKSEHAQDNPALSAVIEHNIRTTIQLRLNTSSARGLQDGLGIENDADSDLADLEMETKPEDVLAEIARLRKCAFGK